ncbi:MAG: ABC transporter permease [Xanthobacteraceae bacterium]|jgi:ABC-type nitrate/sulfonate/bicarbonate transport system permease component
MMALANFARMEGAQARWLRAVGRFLPVVIALALWEAVVDFGLVNRDFLPSFSETFAALWHMAQSGEIWLNLFVSLYRALIGLLIGSLLGLGIGLLMATSERADRFFGPLVATTYSLPKASLVPLFILWFGIGDVTDIVTVVLACLLPVIVSTYHGVKAVPPILIWSARAMGTPERALLWRVLFPASLGSILTGVRIALSFCFVLTISAEMIAAKTGIGKLIFIYGENGAYAFMFGGLMAVVIVAYAADRALVATMHHILRWDDTIHSVTAYD